jgi:hypothetical protein
MVCPLDGELPVQGRSFASFLESSCGWKCVNFQLPGAGTSHARAVTLLELET